MKPALLRRLDQVGRWVRNPLATLTLAAVTATLCGLCLHPQGFVLAIGLAALIAVGVVWPWINLAGLGGGIAFDRARVRAGEPVTVRLSLRNRAPWGAWGLAVDPGTGLDAGLAHVGGWQTAEVAWEFVADRRGVYPTRPARVVSGFPFGLLTARRGLATTGELIVWPQTFAVGPIPTGAGGRISEGNAPRNRPGGSGDFLGVRAYRRGDSLRRVHWPQTARSGQMVICEQQSEAVPQVQVVLDTNLATHADAGTEGSLEWAVRIAASFVHGWISAGAEVDLVLASGTIPTRGGSVANRRAALLDALARLGSTRVPLADLLESPPCRRFASGLRVVVTTDRALAGLPDRATAASGLAERFVLLRADAFDPGRCSAPADPTPIRPWVWLDDPTRVAEQVRRAWREVSR